MTLYRRVSEFPKFFSFSFSQLRRRWKKVIGSWRGKTLHEKLQATEGRIHSLRSALGSSVGSFHSASPASHPYNSRARRSTAQKPNQGRLDTVANRMLQLFNADNCTGHNLLNLRPSLIFIRRVTCKKKAESITANVSVKTRNRSR